MGVGKFAVGVLEREMVVLEFQTTAASYQIIIRYQLYKYDKTSVRKRNYGTLENEIKYFVKQQWYKKQNP